MSNFTGENQNHNTPNRKKLMSTKGIEEIQTNYAWKQPQNGPLSIQNINIFK